MLRFQDARPVAATPDVPRDRALRSDSRFIEHRDRLSAAIEQDD